MAERSATAVEESIITASANAAVVTDATLGLAPAAPQVGGKVEPAADGGPGLPQEVAFYRRYRWCLNPHLTFVEAVSHLREELGRLTELPNGWQIDEVATNIFLLSCALLNGVGEYLRGPALRLPSRLAATRIGRFANFILEVIAARSGSPRRARLRRWRRDWVGGVDAFLAVVVARHAEDPPLPLIEASRRLLTGLPPPLPKALQMQRLAIPSPFGRLDLTQHDVVALGRCFFERCADRSQPILLLGLRTSGSYFAPLLKAFFTAAGLHAAVLTIEPKKGPGRRERRELKEFAQNGYRAVIVDDPPASAGSVLAALDIARRAGFVRDRLTLLVPTHPSSRNWHQSLPEDLVVTLAPEEWHKRALLEPAAVADRLAEYLGGGDLDLRVVDSRDVEASASADERGTRLKRIFEVQLQTPQGERRTRFILAKSVGWGWFGYAAFLAARELAGMVPPMLGLRDGILYMEWLPPRSDGQGEAEDRDRLVDAAARYVAARVRHLALDPASVAGMSLSRHNNAAVLLEKALSRAYGAFPADVLMRARVGRALLQLPCPLRTLIDGNMRRSEWVGGPEGPLKTDYEHHGMGKAALNVTDPAYDLADAILNLELSPAQEARLVQCYIDQSADAEVGERLFVNKLLAGIWAMNQAQEQLRNSARSAAAQQHCHRDFMRAWDFLTVETARFCGRLVRPRAEPGWRAPLLMLDVDGVLDRRLFGFPAITAAGIEALSLLHAEKVCVALNTARSVAEVREYCQAYGLAGGVAEHGGYVWDAVAGRGRGLISAPAMEQLELLRERLRQLPGVFLDDRHQYSIRAFTYRERPGGPIATLLQSVRAAEIGEGAVAPLPNLVVQQLIAELRLDRLKLIRTTIDSTIIAREADKGTGLVALRDWVLGADAETIAVGDSATDLPMFRAATRSFAPAHIGCAGEARLSGCRIAGRAYQNGMLDIVRMLVGAVERQDRPAVPPSRHRDPFLDALRAADRGWLRNLLGAILAPAGYRIFVR